MKPGYVYVLENPSMPGLVKIGLTTRTVEARMRDLNSTGVPQNFVEVYSEYVSDCTAVEKAVHNRLSNYRVNRGREFFAIEADDAAAIVKGISLEWRISPVDAGPRNYIADVEVHTSSIRRCLGWLLSSLQVIGSKLLLGILIVLFIPIKAVGELALEATRTLYEAAIWVAKVAAILALIYLLVHLSA